MLRFPCGVVFDDCFCYVLRSFVVESFVDLVLRSSIRSCTLIRTLGHPLIFACLRRCRLVAAAVVYVPGMLF